MKRDLFPWILGGVAIVLAATLGVARKWTKDRLLKLYDDIFPRYNLPPAWGKAIALWEGRGGLNPGARNLTGGDLKRGGAWGLNQITLQTAKEHGYTGTGVGLLNPVVNVDWMARILSNPIDKHGRHRAPPQSLQEAASMWNSGTYPGDGDTPAVTLTQYIPGVERYAV